MEASVVYEEGNEFIYVHYDRFVMEVRFDKSISLVIESDFRALELGEYISCVDKLCEFAKLIKYSYVCLVVNRREEYSGIVIDYFSNKYDCVLTDTDGEYCTFVLGPLVKN